MGQGLSEVSQIEYSFEEGLKRTLNLSNGEKEFSVKEIQESLCAVLESLSALDSISELPSELILALVSASALPDLSHLNMNSVNGIYIFFGILLAAYINTNDIKITAPIDKIDTDDISTLKLQLDAIYQNREEEVARELEKFKLNLFSYYEDILLAREEVKNEDCSLNP